MEGKTLNIAEKFLVIAHHPEKGRFLISHLYIKYGLAGAILLDMTLEDRISLEDRRLMLKTGRTTTDPVKDEVTLLMSQAGKPHRADYWVRRLAGRYTRYLKQILKGLEEKRVVRIEDRKFLGIIPYRAVFLLESYTRSNIIGKLKNDILVYRASAGDNMALAGLIEACRMHRLLTADRDELRMIRSQVRKIIRESPVSDVVAHTIRQVQIAIITSVTAATVAATAGKH
jgi:hypothetical protein